MKITVIFFALILFPISILATAQAHDILIWKGDTFKLFTNPLELIPNKNIYKAKLFGNGEAGMSTACWRGYIGEWEIIEKEIFLTNIYSCNYHHNKTKANLKKLFGSFCKKGKVKAGWVNGDLLIPKGKCKHYIHDAYDSFYEKEIVLTFKEGKLQKQTEYDNSKSHKSIYTENHDKFKEFIYSNINWDLIPDLKDKEVKVVVSIRSGKTAKTYKLEILKVAEKYIFKKEAIRVLKLLPDWDVYYKSGKVYEMVWNLFIIFNEENRKNYSQ